MLVSNNMKCQVYLRELTRMIRMINRSHRTFITSGCLNYSFVGQARPISGSILLEANLRLFWINWSSKIPALQIAPPPRQPVKLVFSTPQECWNLFLVAASVAWTMGCSSGSIATPEMPSRGGQGMEIFGATKRWVIEGSLGFKFKYGCFQK